MSCPRLVGRVCAYGLADPPLAWPCGNSFVLASDWKPPSFEDWKQKQGRIVWRGSPNDFLGLKKANAHFAPRFKVCAWVKVRVQSAASSYPQPQGGPLP